MTDWFGTVQLWKQHGLQYDGNNKKLILSTDCAESLNSNNIRSELRQGRLHVDRSDLPFSYFQTEAEFTNEVRPSNLRTDVFISDYGGKLFHYRQEDGLTQLDGKVASDYLVENAAIFFDFLKLLEERSNYVPGEFEFVDFYSVSQRKIVFASVVEKLRVTMTFPSPGVPEGMKERSFKLVFEELKQLLDSDNRQLPVFVKNAIITQMKAVGGDSFPVLFQQLPDILREAKLNHNVYLHGLSLKKIRSEYRDFKRKYFSDQNEVLGRISNHALALPVSVSGAAFAISKLQDSNYAVLLVLAGLLAFAVYVSYLAAILWEDLLQIRELIERDYQLLSQNDFFQEHSEELTDFTSTRDWMLKRESKLRKGLMAFYHLVWGSTIGLLIYGVSLLISIPATGLFFCGLLSLALTVSIGNVLFAKADAM
jgi:hypothetical protein